MKVTDFLPCRRNVRHTNEQIHFINSDKQFSGNTIKHDRHSVITSTLFWSIPSLHHYPRMHANNCLYPFVPLIFSLSFDEGHVPTRYCEISNEILNFKSDVLLLHQFRRKYLLVVESQSVCTRYIFHFPK
jgi:hypothetical protein